MFCRLLPADPRPSPDFRFPMPLRNLTVICISMVLSLACYLKAERNRYATVVAEAMHKVRTYYVEDVESRELFENAMKGMVEGLDQYSNYIGPDLYRHLEEDLDQEFGGIGIEIDKPDAETTLMVLSPLVGTPASRGGLRAGDEILSIDGRATVGLPRQDAVKSMRGKPGSKVLLEVRHPGEDESFKVTIEREIIQVQSVLGDTRRPDGSWDFQLHENSRIAYLRLTGFGKYSVAELTRILTESRRKPFEAALIDLRGNAGGLLSASVAACDLFIDKGLIVSTRGRDRLERDRFDATSDVIIPTDFPLVVLVDHNSASASEIVAACLQDHERAIVVGERTWGKGTVQNIFEMEGGRSALKLTTASYWRPSGQNIHRGRKEQEDENGTWGVRPNKGFEIVLTDEQRRQVLLQRRRRDVVHGLKYRPEAIALRVPVDTESTDQDAVETRQDPTAGNDQQFDDPQLRRAVEYLEQQLLKIDAKSRTA